MRLENSSQVPGCWDRWTEASASIPRLDSGRTSSVIDSPSLSSNCNMYAPSPGQGWIDRNRSALVKGFCMPDPWLRGLGRWGCHPSHLPLKDTISFVIASSIDESVISLPPAAMHVEKSVA